MTRTTKDGGAADLTTDDLKRLAARLLLEAPHVEGWEDEDGDPVPFADDIRAAVQVIRELIERREADGWQPIETAPATDDYLPLILLWVPHDMGGYTFVGTRNVAGNWIDNLVMDEHQPTNWQPLPEPPTPPKEASNA